MGCGLNYGVIAGRIPKIDIGNWIILIHDIFIAQLCQAVSRAVLRSSGILIGIIESICSILLDFRHIVSRHMLVNGNRLITKGYVKFLSLEFAVSKLLCFFSLSRKLHQMIGHRFMCRSILYEGYHIGRKVICREKNISLLRELILHSLRHFRRLVDVFILCCR